MDPVSVEVERKIRDENFKTKFVKEALIRLAKLSVNHMEFKIKNKYYKQNFEIEELSIDWKCNLPRF